jgi:glutaredoxin 2
VRIGKLSLQFSILLKYFTERKEEYEGHYCQRLTATILKNLKTAFRQNGIYKVKNITNTHWAFRAFE